MQTRSQVSENKKVMKHKILNLLKLAIGIGLFVGIVALTILRLRG